MMQGKVALVTGGSSGIGLATAHLFARQGASVVIAARNPQRGAAALYALRAAGADAEFVQTDVSVNDEVSALLRAVIERYDRLDFAVNSAATDEVGMGLTADLSEAEFDSAIALNLKSTWLCMKYEIKRMLEQREGGSIVNVSSVNGLGGVPGAGTYAVAKAGVIALAKSAAMEYAARRIPRRCFGGRSSGMRKATRAPTPAAFHWGGSGTRKKRPKRPSGSARMPQAMSPGTP
jgi:NAD(P)-dependent dehydrogenase (short-subunit alcohol dehydrogenase family)